MVDTVISLEGERNQAVRILRVLKNRFGPNQELLIFQMLDQGLELVEDTATFFLGARDPALSGSAVAMSVEGQRILAVEAQALAARSYLAVPRRASLGLDLNRLYLILAVLEKRLKIGFGQTDLYVKIGGGLRLQEPGLDLALAAAILSSYYDLPLPERAVFWGEVDLNGRIRPVSAHTQRRDQASRLGYAPLFHPKVEGEGISNLGELVEALFRDKKPGYR
jgi:DNA repair protein RadA/Sms